MSKKNTVSLNQKNPLNLSEKSVHLKLSAPTMSLLEKHARNSSMSMSAFIRAFVENTLTLVSKSEKPENALIALLEMRGSK